MILVVMLIESDSDQLSVMKKKEDVIFQALNKLFNSD